MDQEEAQRRASSMLGDDETDGAPAGKLLFISNLWLNFIKWYLRVIGNHFLLRFDRQSGTSRDRNVARSRHMPFLYSYL